MPTVVCSDEEPPMAIYDDYVPDDGPDWEPPPSVYDEAPPPQHPPDSYRSGPDAPAPAVAAPAIDGRKAAEVIRQVVRATHRMTAANARSVLTQITTDRSVIDLCPDRVGSALAKLVDALVTECSLLLDDERLDLSRIDVRMAREAWAELVTIRDIPDEDVVPNPQKVFAAAAEAAQLNKAIESAQAFLAACARRDRTEQLVALHRQIEAPTRQQSTEAVDYVRTASEWIEHRIATAGEQAQVRLSSGFRSLDLALTQPGAEPGTFAEPLGSFGPGEFWVFPAGTGHGKSAFARPLATSLLLDLHNWGMRDSKVLYAFVEETPDIIISAARMDEGDPYNHVAKNLLLANVGASRRRFIETVYRSVMEAEDHALMTGRPITSALARVVILDYIGGPKASGETDAQAIETNADLLLRGIANWNPDDMALFTGLDYRTYSGRQWPEGMENFRPTVIMFAQLLSKIDGPKTYASKYPMDMFNVENPDGSWGWEVREGDERIPTQNHIRGSSVLVNHATGVVFLHRSRPQKNPPVWDERIGRRRLLDTRSRLILDKTRNGSTTAFVPSVFDSNPKGQRGMWYDIEALEALRQGYLTDITEDWAVPGDPILPIRPKVSPFRARY